MAQIVSWGSVAEPLSLTGNRTLLSTLQSSRYIIKEVSNDRSTYSAFLYKVSVKFRSLS